MTSIETEFKIDFTSHLQKADLPTYQKASAAYNQTLPGAPLNVEFRRQRDGIFIVRTFSENDAKKLEEKYLTFYYGKNEKKQVKFNLIKMPKFVFYQNPKWIYIDWLSDGNLRNVKMNNWTNFWVITVT